MALARLLAVPWIVLEVLTEESRTVPPWGRGPGLMLAGLLLLGGVCIAWASKRSISMYEARGVGVVGLALDSAVICGFVWLYSSQPLSGIWAAMYMLPLEAAFFFGLVGSLTTCAILIVVYSQIQVLSAHRFGFPLSWNTIGFQMGIALLISVISGMMARSLHRERDALERELEERWRAERQLAERHRQLTEAREIARLGAWEWDKATDRVTWSEGLYEMHGMTDGFDGTPEAFRALQHPEDRDRVSAALARAMRERGSFSIDFRIIRPDGEERFLRGKGETLVNRFGEATGLFGTVQDITAQREIENALHEVNVELQRSVTELERRNLQATLTASMGEMLLSCVTHAEIDAVVRDFGQRMFPGSEGSLAVVRNGTLVVTASWPRERSAVTSSPSESCWGLRLRRPHVAPAGPLAQRCSHQPDEDRSSICVPMIAQGEVLGVMAISSTGEASWMNDGPGTMGRRLAQTMAEYVGLALANLDLREELRDQSVRDPLTGLFNRRYLMETLDRDLQRAQRAGSPLTLLAIDVDHFKELNDSAGHAAGDDALRELGAFLSTSIRAGDVACRTGGDEFTVVLEGATLEEAMARAERLREGARELMVVSEQWQMSVSIGVAGVPPFGVDAETLQRSADAALYRAKRSGRDQVAMSETPNEVQARLRLAVGE